MHSSGEKKKEIKNQIKKDFINLLCAYEKAGLNKLPNILQYPSIKTP
jgi:hypothetical protein